MPAIIGTAGHIDHGKTALIKALTGQDTDRLKEEKERGISIDLGFAYFDLAGGDRAGVVDVPGHERFIRNMLAGVGPAPLVLFVVAADEGWKPQSEEHLEILDVLGVGSGVIALTKCDLVDDETIGFAEQEILERLEGTTLEGAPIVRLSSVTGAGIDDLRAALDAMLERAQVPSQSPPRLFVDRVFTIKGAGTVTAGAGVPEWCPWLSCALAGSVKPPPTSSAAARIGVRIIVRFSSKCDAGCSPRRRPIEHGERRIANCLARIAAVPALITVLSEADPVVRGAVAWALGQLGGDAVQAALQERRGIEDNPDVLLEIDDALQRCRTP